MTQSSPPADLAQKPPRIPPGLVSKVLIILAGFAVLLVGIGFALPSTYEVERRTRLAAPPAVVAPLITDFAAWPAWQPWGRDDEKAEFTAAGAVGPGQTLTWTGGKIGRGELVATAVDPAGRIEMTMDFGRGGPTPTATLTVEATDDGGSRVIWKVDGETPLQPVGNYLGLVMDGIVGPDLAAGLERLKQQAEAKP